MSAAAGRARRGEERRPGAGPGARCRGRSPWHGSPRPAAAGRSPRGCGRGETRAGSDGGAARPAAGRRAAALPRRAAVRGCGDGASLRCRLAQRVAGAPRLGRALRGARRGSGRGAASVGALAPGRPRRGQRGRRWWQPPASSSFLRLLRALTPAAAGFSPCLGNKDLLAFVEDDRHVQGSLCACSWVRAVLYSLTFTVSSRLSFVVLILCGV